MPFARQDQPTRREVLAGLAAASITSALPVVLSAEPPAPTLCFVSAVEMAALIRAKKLSAREALAEHLKQIDRVNPQVNAIVTLVADQATAAVALATTKATAGFANRESIDFSDESGCRRTFSGGFSTQESAYLPVKLSEVRIYYITC